jgi:hypothetical protein
MHNKKNATDAAKSRVIRLSQAEAQTAGGKANVHDNELGESAAVKTDPANPPAAKSRKTKNATGASKSRATASPQVEPQNAGGEAGLSRKRNKEQKDASSNKLSKTKTTQGQRESTADSYSADSALPTTEDQEENTPTKNIQTDSPPRLEPRI